MNTITILVDDRERKIIPEFDSCPNKTSIVIKVERINIGDYAFYYKNKLLVCIERKSWVDLAASMTDGRKENVDNLLYARKESGCAIVYLIEGTSYPTNRKMLPKIRIPFKALRSHLDHLALRGIIIIYSRNYNDTAHRILDFAENFTTTPMVKELLAKVGGNDDDEKKNDISYKIVKTPIVKSNESILSCIWRCVAGITLITYEIIKPNYVIQDLILGTVTAEELAQLKYENTNRTLSIRKAHKIIRSAKTTEVHIKMLSKVQGVTIVTASQLLYKFKLSDIINGIISRDSIANHKKKTHKTHKTRKLGYVVADRIIDIFSSKNEKNKESDNVEDDADDETNSETNSD